jgi:hypothetical protein
LPYISSKVTAVVTRNKIKEAAHGLRNKIKKAAHRRGR